MKFTSVMRVVSRVARRGPRAVAALSIAVSSLLGIAAAPAQSSPQVQDVIVVLRTSVRAADVANEHAGVHGFSPVFVYEHAIKGYAARVPAARLSQIQADPRVLYISEDRPVQTTTPATPPAAQAKPGSGGGDATAPTQEVPTGVRRIDPRVNGKDGQVTVLNNTGTGVGVAVIDTGIDLKHPDLQSGGRLVDAKTCVTGTRNANDDNGHGTHVAGTIAASDNNEGVVGVAPEATLYAVKVLNRNGSGSWSSVICGIDWVTANSSKVQVANMSLGGSGTATASYENLATGETCLNANNDALHTAICRSVGKGVTYVVAAGNSKADATNSVPAAYEEVITVSALSDSDGKVGGTGGNPTCRTGEKDDYFASFSNYGAPVDIAAPGVCIKSTWRGGGYNTISGTSMAAPHVAGVAARYKSANSGATPAQVQAALVTNQEPGPITGDPDSTKEGVVKLY